MPSTDARINPDDWLAGAPVAPRNVGGRPATDRRGRQRKLECQECGLIAYASAAAILRAPDRPQCCGEPLTLPNLRDRAVVEWDALETELASAGRATYEAAMRELGYRDMLAPPRPRRSGLAPARCQWESGHCMKYVAGRFCPEHDPHEIARRAA